ncbi:MAG TPA: hypothetical protein VLJ86_27105, partial [Ramlibacter sp.]|nr:hypothetical protein [Ramlibacter sp.]
MAKYAKYTKHTIPKHNGHAALLEAQEIWDKDYRRGSLRDAVKRYFRKPDNPDKLTEPVIDKLFQGDRDEHDYRYRVAIEACAKLLQSEYETLFSPIPSVAGKMFKGTKPDFDQHLKAIWYNDYTSRFHNELPIPAKASENIRRRVKTIAEYVSRIPACNPLDLDLQQRIGKRLLTRG